MSQWNRLRHCQIYVLTLSHSPHALQVQLYGDVPTGAARFADLAKGIQGVGYKRS